MLRSWRLGKLFAIPLYVHPTFLLIPLLVVLQALKAGSGVPLVGIPVLVLLVLSIFGCVLLHELGHALMARYFGIGTLDITLYPIGGVARLNRMSDDPKQELAIALAGPAVNVVIFALLAPLVLLLWFSGAVSPGNLFFEFLAGLWIVNGLLVLFNMLPAFPMDGGRVLRALLSMGLGQLRATEIAAKLGLVMAGMLCLYSLFTWNVMLFFVGGFVAFAGQQELFMLRRRAQAQAPHPIPSPPPDDVYDVPTRPFHVFEPTYRPSEPGFTGYTWDAHYRVWVKWLNGEPVGAFWGELH